jgi:hypothetical protein
VIAAATLEQVLRGGRAGLRYGALAFLAGAATGMVRELLLAPWIGGLPAALLEGAVMAVLILLAARSVLERMPPRQGLGARLAFAVAALALVLAAEAALSVAFETSGIAEARAPRSPAELAVGPALLLWFAVLPLLLRR